MNGRHDGGLKRKPRRSAVPRALIKGRPGSIITVKAPNPMFHEAIFILRDDLFSKRELSRDDILRQAAAAAENYTAAVAPAYPSWRLMAMCGASGLILGLGIGLVI